MYTSLPGERVGDQCSGGWEYRSKLQSMEDFPLTEVYVSVTPNLEVVFLKPSSVLSQFLFSMIFFSIVDNSVPLFLLTSNKVREKGYTLVKVLFFSFPGNEEPSCNTVWSQGRLLVFFDLCKSFRGLSVPSCF